MRSIAVRSEPAGYFASFFGHARMIVCILVLYFPGEAKAQSHFEVASIRPVAGADALSESGTRSQIELAADGVAMRNISLSEMIEWAYRLQHYQLKGPVVHAGTRYDVRAKAGEAVDDVKLRIIMQDLLAARFHVGLHREHKMTSVYELVVAKGGPRLPNDKTAASPLPFAHESFPRVVDGSFVFSNVTLGEFAQQLTELRGIDLPVIDRTGIAGVYDITLKSAASAMLDPNGPSLLTLIHEQLGLKLQAAREPLEVVVVDRFDQPSGN